MKTENIHNIAVLGTGTMGPGIAIQFARAGFHVTLWGRNETSRENGSRNLQRCLDELQEEEILDEEEARRIRDHTFLTADLEEATADAQLLVEAIPEILEMKQELFAGLEGICSRETIFASTTSTLLPTPLSEKLEYKDRLIVTHFWNPAYLAPLVEVCGSGKTSQAVTETTMALLKKTGNQPVLMRKEIPGFLGNRIMHAMNREALNLINEGVCDPEDIDLVVNMSFGPRFANLGPMEYLDAVGLDLVKNIQGYLYGDLDDSSGVMPLIDRLVREGNLGMKTGKGLFDWSMKEDRIRENRDKDFIRRWKEMKQSCQTYGDDE
jgi:3-hydroxybutyryl-CoA dehydrogenase